MIIPNKNIRKTILNIINAAGASHIGASLSLVEILNTVYKNVDISKIKNSDIDHDRIVLSKGHAASCLYAVMYHHGLLDKSLIDTYFKNNTILAGHVSHYVPFVEHSTGGLGHGLSVGVGMTIGLKTKKSNSKVFVILGDGEMQEGSNWEAIMLAGHHKLQNLIILVDINELGQVEELENYCSLEPLAKKFESFNFDVQDIDGHNEIEIDNAIKKAFISEKPSAILCRTKKGYGVSFMEKNILWHYKSPIEEDYEKALKELNE